MDSTGLKHNHKNNAAEAIRQSSGHPAVKLVNSRLILINWKNSGGMDAATLSAEYFITFDVKRGALYNPVVINTFRDKEIEGVFYRQFSRKLPSDIQQVALRMLRMLHNAGTLADLRIPPANHLEKLAGQRAGQYSIRINDQWRICFEWHKDNAYNVEITDYH